jgi:hypothetical protein
VAEGDAEAEAVIVGEGVLVAEGLGVAVRVTVTMVIGRILPPGHAMKRMPTAKISGMMRMRSPNRFMKAGILGSEN